MDVIDLGLIPYSDALAHQERIHAERVKGNVPDTIIFCEHPPVYTMGKRDCVSDLLLPIDEIKSLGIDVVKTNRGGRITYHGPGQLVGYLIAKLVQNPPLGGLGVKEFVRMIEEMLVSALGSFGINASRDAAYPGVWVDSKKIAAIGLRISRGVTMHGFALNVSPNMDHYQHIIPCGIKDRGVTSMKKVLGYTPGLSQMRDAIVKALNRCLSVRYAQTPNPCLRGLSAQR